jgi:1-carboxybiuret hydrolase subunit AtzH-like protein
MEIDRPDVVAEVAEAFARYEDALVAQNHAALDGWFWDDPRVVRYGIRELQYGHAAIAAWRPRSPHVGDDRTLRNTVVTAFGPDHAVVATEFFRPGGHTIGRQSQTWARLDDGWQVVHAHVSVVDGSAVDRGGEPQR